MWKNRQLGLRNLCELGSLLLEDPQYQALRHDAWWQAAFEGCNSPAEWQEFLDVHGGDPRTAALIEAYHQIDDRNQSLPRNRLKQPVILPESAYGS